MTLAAAFKFEHPKAQGVSPIMLLSESRFSYTDVTIPPRDTGKKIHTMAINIGAVFAGDVLEAQRAFVQVKKCLALSSSGSFEDLGFFLESSFNSTITTWNDAQTPHCLLGAISKKGDSKLFYARPNGTSYKVTEGLQFYIGDERLGQKLQKKIYEFKPYGLYQPKHFMCLPYERYQSGHDLRNQAIRDARQISGNISKAFVEIVEESKEAGVHLPLQSVLLMPSGPEQINIYDMASSTQVARKTARPNEVY